MEVNIEKEVEVTKEKIRELNEQMQSLQAKMNFTATEILRYEGQARFLDEQLELANADKKREKKDAENKH